jgi:hypothetical protein
MLVKHSTISDKVYFEHPESNDIKVPFKKISQTDTISENGSIKNPDLIVYDTFVRSRFQSRHKRHQGA